MNINELARIIADEPHNVALRKARARAIARSGADDAELGMKIRRDRYQHVDFRDYASGASDSFPHSDATHMKLHHRARADSWATIAIEYTLANRAYYWLGKDLAYYIDAYTRGHISDGELDWLANLVECMATKEGRRVER